MNLKRIINNNIGLSVLLFFLVCSSFLGYQRLFSSGYTNEILNSLAPNSTDATQYASLSERMTSTASFRDAFSDGYRVPGYPFFLSICRRMFTEPFLAARIIQLLLTCMLIPISYFTLFGITGSRVSSLLAALLSTVWIPFYYFPSLLLPESLSLFIFGLILFLLPKSKNTSSVIYAFLSGLSLAVLVYLKPNHFLLVLPIAAIFYESRFVRRKTVLIITFLLTIGIMVIPWTIYVSSANEMFIPLTTTSGMNMLLGTGVSDGEDFYTGEPDPSAEATLPSRFSRSLHLGDSDMMNGLRSEATGLSVAKQNKLFTGYALSIWHERPLKTVTYCILKILHGFGFSLRGSRDLIIAGFSVLSFLACILLKRWKKYKVWTDFFLLTAAVLALQMFIYLPNQRFKTVVFDLPAILVISLAAGDLIQRFSKKNPSTLGK